MSSSSSSHFAVTCGTAEALLVPPSRFANSNTRNDNDEDHGDDFVEYVYRSYAELYPNPDLTQEYLQRDELLQQIQHELDDENNKAIEQQQQQPVQKKRGLFGIIFGSSPVAPAPSSITRVIREEDYLVYYYTHHDNDAETNTRLCGTQFVLETQCIPPEAHAVARFHLASTGAKQLQQQQQEQLIVSVEGSSSLLLVVILGLGVIAELVDGDKTWNVSETSDKDDLDQHIHHQQRHQQQHYCLQHVRACMIGDDCLAVSWGLPDGIIVIYRRFVSQSNSRWHALAMLAPTGAVLANVQSTSDVFLQQDSFGSLSSPLLRVTQVARLLVESGTGMAATLVVSRLGGYMEFIPLSPQLWEGQQNTKPPPKRKKSRQQQHYSMGHLYNIGSDQPEQIAALTVGEHLDDVLQLQVVRTSVGVETEWDGSTSNHPPAEYLLVANGTKNGEERLTFWAVATIFSDDPSSKDFSIHVAFLEEYTLGSVGQVSLFCKHGILQHWRRPRRVQRKEFQAATELPEPATTASQEEFVATLTIPAPVISMRFHIQSPTGKDDHKLLLAVCDYNGGVSILNCTTVLQRAEQAMTPEQLAFFEENDATMTTMLFSRDAIHQQLCGCKVADIAWTARGELVVATITQKLVILPSHGSTDQKNIPSMSLPSSSARTKLVSTDEAVSLLLLSRGGKKLVTGELRLASPRSIIERLMQSSKYNEALDAAAAFPDQSLIQSVVETCHKRLWETEHQVEHLEAVSDDLYVMEQVISLFRRNDVNLLDNVTSYRLTCRLGLRRCSTMRVELALQLSDPKVQPNLTRWSLRAGTYSLLCQHFGVEGDSMTFMQTFLDEPLVGLASNLAAMGDVKALTIIFSRHANELQQSRLHSLTQIPHSVDPSVFAHLLPVCTTNDYYTTLEYFVGRGVVQPISALRQVVQEEFGYSILLDDEEPCLLQQNNDTLEARENTDENEGLSRPELASWFVQRAKQMQKAVGNLSALLSFCDLAILCLTERNGKPQEDENVNKLVAIRAFAQHMEGMLSLNEGDLTASTEAEILKTDIDDLASMPIYKLLSMLLGKPQSEKDASARFERHVLPVLSMPGIADEEKMTDEKGISSDTVDQALTSYCCDLLKPSDDNEVDIQDIRNAMAVCVAVAQASRSSLNKNVRIIKSRQSMMEFVLSLSEQLSMSCRKISLLPSDARDLVMKLWQAYECLASRLTPQEEESNKELVALNDRVDTLFRLLIAADIMAQWSPSDIFTILSIEKVNWVEIATLICEAFCKEAGMRHKTFDKKVILLRDVASDLVQLRADACQLMLDLESIVHEVLLMGLLQQGEFELFVEVFNTELGSMANWDQMQPAVLRFVNEAMFGDDQDTESSRFAFETDKIHSAIQCQDVLGSRFPQLQASFGGMRRHLDAAHFINTVLLSGDRKSNLSPSALREMLPMDIVEHTLEENPLCVVVGCNDWADIDYGRQKIQEIVAFHDSYNDPQSNDSPIPEPEFPGGAVLHLANIVGLESQACHSLIQNRIVHYAKLADLPWVGAATVLAMLHTDSTSIALNSLILDATAAVVSDQTYEDVIIKSMLCRKALSRPALDRGSSSLAMVVKAFGELEHKVSRFCPTMWNRNQPSRRQSGSGLSPPKGQSEFLVFRAAGLLANTAKNMVQDGDTALSKPKSLFTRVLKPRPIDRVFQDSLGGYSTDLNSLFQILQEKSARCEEDDPLLIAIARMYVFWCISNSVRVTELDTRGSFEQANAYANLELGISLMLHSRDKDAIVSNLDEMKEIAEAQSVSALEIVATHAAIKPVRPDLGIVRKLIELGYSENGARRAAVMTNNQSQQAAMVWAVAHAEESFFNSPLIFVKPRRDPRIDQDAMRDVKRSLYMVDQYVKADESVLSSDIFNLRISPETDHSLLLQSFTSKEEARNGKNGSAANSSTHEVLSRAGKKATKVADGPRQPTAALKSEKVKGPPTLPPSNAASSASNLEDNSEDTVLRPEPNRQQLNERDPLSAPRKGVQVLSATIESPLQAEVQALPPQADEKRLVGEATPSSSQPATSTPSESSKVILVGEMAKFQRMATESPSAKSDFLPEHDKAKTTYQLDVPKSEREQQAGKLQKSSASSTTRENEEVLLSVSRRAAAPVDSASTRLASQVLPTPPESIDTALSPRKKGTTLENKTAPIQTQASPASAKPPPRQQPQSPITSGAHIPRSPRSAPAILDRSTLKKTGELVRQRSRGLSNRLDHDERKRLYRKGILLFEKARGSPTKLGTPSPRTTPLKLSKAATSPRSPLPAAPRSASDPLLGLNKLPQQPPSPAPVARPPPPPPPRPPPLPPKPSTAAKPVEDDLLDMGDGWDFEDEEDVVAKEVGSDPRLNEGGESDEDAEKDDGDGWGFEDF